MEGARPTSAGNGALLVLVDSGGPFWERRIVDETVLSALTHFGMPFRLLDLAQRRPMAADLADCAVVVLAQNGLGGALTDAEAQGLADAVAAGGGLVSFDYDLRPWPAPLLAMFGFEGINPHPYVTDQVRIRPGGHYITGLQEEGEFHHFDRMVTAVAVERWGEHVVPLAEGILGKEQLVTIRHLAPWSAFEPRNFPLLFAGRHGSGRAVQCTLNQRVWRRAFYGRARGMDDLFWRSILWAARKPFVTNAVPPFVTMSFDDCQGRHDFAYADIAADHGFVPMPSLFLERVPERYLPQIRAGMESGRIRYGAHALDYYRLLVYDFGKGEYELDRLREIFAFEDDFWRRVGTRPGPTLRLHWGEYGVRSLPFLKERGYRYFCPALQTGLHKADMSMDDGFRPYGLQTCYYDQLPDDPDFYTFAAMLARTQEDFLSGCTAYLGERERTDVEAAAANAAKQIQHGLRAGFHAEILTHEQKLDAVSMDEWEAILIRAGALSEPYEKIHAGHDEIGAYLRGRDGVSISASHVEGESARCTLQGTSDVPLKLSVFRDVDDGVEQEYREVDAFVAETEIEA